MAILSHREFLKQLNQQLVLVYRPTLPRPASFR